MRFGFEQRFKTAVADVVTITDPWGMGLTLEVYRDGAVDLQKRLRKINLANPLTQRINRVLGKGAMLSIGRGRMTSGEQFGQLLDAEVEHLQLTAEEGETLLRQRVLEAAAKIKSWSGSAVVDPETKKEIVCTEESKLELLEHPLVLPEGEPFAGLEVGSALVAIIHDAAAGQDISREKYLADLGKGSGSTSGGDSAAIPTNPTSSESSLS